MEEGTRNVVAECLGKLTLIDPATLLPRLQESLKSSSALMRTTTVTAVKFTISDQVRYPLTKFRNSDDNFRQFLAPTDRSDAETVHGTLPGRFRRS